jgi:hypothetical protein
VAGGPQVKGQPGLSTARPCLKKQNQKPKTKSFSDNRMLMEIERKGKMENKGRKSQRQFNTFEFYSEE